MGTLLANPWKCCFGHFELCTFFDTFCSFGSFGNLWPHIRHQNVTGPPGALLFDRDHRSHWNNHYNCCFFVWVATLGIYCTDFLPQLLAQVKYPMQFGWASYLAVVTNTLNRYWNNSMGNWTALSEEICLHWATMHWMIGIRNNERICHLAGNDTSHYQSKEN